MNPLAGHRGLLLQELRQKGLRRRLPLELVVGEVVLLGVPQGHHPLVFVEVRLALATRPVALEADDAKQLLRRLVRDLQPTHLERPEQPPARPELFEHLPVALPDSYSGALLQIDAEEMDSLLPHYLRTAADRAARRRSSP